MARRMKASWRSQTSHIHWLRGKWVVFRPIWTKTPQQSQRGNPLPPNRDARKGSASLPEPTCFWKPLQGFRLQRPWSSIPHPPGILSCSGKKPLDKGVLRFVGERGIHPTWMACLLFESNPWKPPNILQVGHPIQLRRWIDPLGGNIGDASQTSQEVSVKWEKPL